MKTSVVSHHMYFFPFTWEGELAPNKRSMLKNHESQSTMEENLISWKRRDRDIIVDRQYNELVYFYKPVQSVLYEYQNSKIIKIFDKVERHEDDYLEVMVEDKKYILSVEEISLKLYKNGIGILSIEVINNKYEALDDIIAINSIGKCVYPYSLPIEEAQNDYFPQEIKIQIAKKCITEKFDKNYKKNIMCITDFLMGILGPSFSNNKQTEEKNIINIDPLFSNRMYTVCVYKNDELLSAIQQKKIEDTLFHTFILCSKQDNVFGVTKIHLDNISYSIGRFSFIGVTKYDYPYKMFNELATLAVLQRASLLHFSNQLAWISTLPKIQLIEGIRKLYEIYVQFINQMYFDEVTVDMQGSALYEALVKELRIKEELAELDFEMREVHEYSSIIQKQQSQKRMDFLAIVGALLVLPTFVTGFFGMNILEDRFMKWWMHEDVWLFLNSYLLLPVVIILFIYSCAIKGFKSGKIGRQVLLGLMAISMLVLMTRGCGLVRM
ncbi:MAG: CorA family divalent cation transporter [Cellulosilyticaceae bacterium]